MAENRNHLGQVVGARVTNWRAPDFPSHEVLAGTHCRIEPLDINRHASSLFETTADDKPGKMWTYLPYGPFDNAIEYCELLKKLTAQSDQQFYAVVDVETGRALGVAAYLRINPEAGSIEIGHLSYSPLLQRSILATEAMYLMMKKIFEAGYRRYEWKCHSLNAASKSAALRLGFQFEGIFRQSMVIDGRNRDTAWYSIIDEEWPKLQTTFETWLASSNFDSDGQQRRRLQEFFK
ncbi:MAG: GNAT family N-acetyltransferase [Gammaproteobacteria bacterium]